MLERIEVDGFKSLVDFSLSIRPGLNVLVGPNGSGKSSIVLFFEFLSYLADHTVMQAISRAGGAGTLFTQLEDGKLRPTLSFSISGVGDYRERERTRQALKPGVRSMRYEYSASIELDLELASLSFQHQSLKLFDTDPHQEGLAFEPVFPNLDIDWQDTGEEPRVKVSTVDNTIFSPAFSRERDTSIDAERMLRSAVEENARDFSLFQFLSYIVQPMRIIRSDLIEGRAYNIDPNVVRQSEDIASEPGIRFDGAGLAATLYAAKKAREAANKSSRPRLRFVIADTDLPTDLVDQVSKYARIVNDNILEIGVDSNPIENKLRVWLLHKGGKTERGIKMPISLASDGTVKWLALTAAVISSTSAIAVEEPENFLHPHMQTEIVNLIRELSQARKTRMFALLTTHSETLLNAANPDEVVVVNMVHGRTSAARPSNADELLREISDTGFGLGYFYVTGAVR